VIVDGGVEIGYGLAPSARGRGLGTEAVGVLVAWAEQQPGVRRVAARVQVGNEPSRRLLRRLGFVEQDEQPGWVLCVRDLEQPALPLRVAGRHVC
jgi:RimJ/RimL family protein N-acetyltransferase